MNYLDSIEMNNGKLTSLQLVEMINFFRKDIEGKNELRHDTLRNIIKDEFEEELLSQEILEKVSESTGGRPSKYFELTPSQAKQLLVRESKSVRKAVIKRLEELEGGSSVPKSYAQALLEAGRLALELEQQQALLIETKEVLEEKTIQLDESKEWFSIKRMAYIVGKDWREFSWKMLKNESRVMEIEVKKIFDANYPKGVNVYHKDVWAIVYPEVQKFIGYEPVEFLG